MLEILIIVGDDCRGFCKRTTEAAFSSAATAVGTAFGSLQFYILRGWLAGHAKLAGCLMPNRGPSPNSFLDAEFSLSVFDDLTVAMRAGFVRVCTTLRGQKRFEACYALGGQFLDLIARFAAISGFKTMAARSKSQAHHGDATAMLTDKC